MLAVKLSEEELRPYLVKLKQGLDSQICISIACYNSTRSLTLSGGEEQIDRLYSLLSDRQVQAQKLKVNVAYHSAHMEPISKDYADAIRSISPGKSTKIGNPTMISTVTGLPISAYELRQNRYWVSNLVSPVRFSDALKQLTSRTSNTGAIKLDWSHTRYLHADTIVEIGPHAAFRTQVLDAAREHGSAGALNYHPTLVRNADGVESVLSLSGHLFCSGSPVNLQSINFPFSGKANGYVRHDLPPYPFDKMKTYWCESNVSRNLRLKSEPEVAFLGKRAVGLPSHNIKWHQIINPPLNSWVYDHAVSVFKDL